MKLLISIVFMAILIPTLSFADNKIIDKPQKQSGIAMLPTDLRTLLKQEMLFLEKGMQSLIPAYVSGNWVEIERIANKMESSYILKQNLTDEQKKVLHATLPNSFIKLDQQFHYFSGMLEHVAKNEKIELIGFYISKLTESCVGCHMQFATDRFPAFEPKKLIEEHSH